MTPADGFSIAKRIVMLKLGRLLCTLFPSLLVLPTFVGAVTLNCNADLKTATAVQATVVQSGASDNLSQFVRSNSSHYWAYMSSQANMRSLANLQALLPFLNFTGVIAGDPHMGNFAPVPVIAGGEAKMAFLNVDFDDAGEGPLVLDFIRFEVTVKSVFADIRKKDMEEAYVRGLRGETVAAPMQLQSILSLTYSQYQAEADQFTDKKTNKDGFKFKAGEIEPYSGNISRGAIENLFPNERVIDLATRPEVRGGSASSQRIWVLVEEGSGRRRIMELKQYEPSGLNAYQTQASPSLWVDRVHSAFWPGLSDATYKLVDLMGGQLFWLRQKAVTLIDVPYTSSKHGKLAYAEGLAIYDANQLGLVHGRQGAGKEMLTAIERDREVFHSATEAVVDNYLEVARNAFGH